MKNFINSSFQILEQKPKIHKEVVIIDKGFDIDALYKKLRPHLINQPKINRNVIECLRYAEKIFKKYEDNHNKSVQLPSQLYRQFKNVQKRLTQQLNQLIATDSIEAISYVKKTFQNVIVDLQKKAKKYWQYERQRKETKKISDELAKQKQQHDEQIKKEMLDLVERFRSHAVDIGKNLEQDTSVISQINLKQDRHMNSLKKKNMDIKDLMKSQKIGFIELIGMAAVGLGLWILCLLFIIIL